MSDLILGTAEFNPAGYAGKPCPDTKEIIRILNLAWEAGVRTLDCADTYGTEGIEQYFGGFWRINKSRYIYDPAGWYHYKPGETRMDGVTRASVYDVQQIPPKYQISGLIVPFNINNTKFQEYTRHFVRSVFDRGHLLEQGYTVKDCLSFVKRYEPQGVIVGVNNTQELQEILLAWS